MTWIQVAIAQVFVSPMIWVAWWASESPGIWVLPELFVLVLAWAAWQRQRANRAQTRASASSPA